MARGDQLLDLHFPVGGVDFKNSFQRQPPYTACGALNVRSQDTVEGRERGGSRPGLFRHHGIQISGTNPVNLLTTVNAVRGDGKTYWQDDFRGREIGDVWEHVGSIFDLDTGKHLLTAPLPTPPTAPQLDLLLHKADPGITDFDYTREYRLAILIVPDRARHHGEYYIYGGQTTYSTFWTGWQAKLVLNGGATGAYSGNVITRLAGNDQSTYAFTGGSFTRDSAGWLEVVVTYDAGPPIVNNLKVYWRGTQILNQNVTHYAGNQYYGLGMKTTGAAGFECLIDAFQINYYSTAYLESVRTSLVAAAGGVVKVETVPGKPMDTISSTLTLADDRPLMATDRGQKVYVADNEVRVVGADGVIAAGGVDLTAASVPDWAAEGADVQDDLVVITNGVGVVNGVYAISTIVGATLTLATVAGAGTCSYRVERGPKVIDPLASPMTLTMLTATAGAVPVGCTLVTLWGDRLVWAGAADPYLWYMPRQGTPTDYDYGASSSDAQRAVAATNSDAGRVGEPIRALVPFNDDTLLFGCEKSLWLLRGNPAAGGQIHAVSRQVGIISARAWCYGPSREVYFLSRDGLYVMPPGGGEPTSLSREKGRGYLIEIDPKLYVVNMEYEIRDRGIHLFVTSMDTRLSGQHVWIDPSNGAFWPMEYPSAQEPYSTAQTLEATPEDSAVILGCRDGRLRRFYRFSDDDDGADIESYVEYGPVGVSDDWNQMVAEVIPTLGALSGPVRFRIRVGKSAEEAVDASTFSSSLACGGWNYRWSPRATGQAFVLYAGAEQDEGFQMEGLKVKTRPMGQYRG